MPFLWGQVQYPQCLKWWQAQRGLSKHLLNKQMTLHVYCSWQKGKEYDRWDSVLEPGRDKQQWVWWEGGEKEQHERRTMPWRWWGLREPTDFYSFTKLGMEMKKAKQQAYLVLRVLIPGLFATDGEHQISLIEAWKTTSLLSYLSLNCVHFWP